MKMNSTVFYLSWNSILITTVKLYELLIVAAEVAGVFKLTSVSYFWSKSIQPRSVL